MWNSYLILFILFTYALPLRGQQMLLLERYNRAKTTRIYAGQSIRFRYVGPEKYWYTRTITGVSPRDSVVFLDNFPVKIAEIGYLKVQKRPFPRTLGAALTVFGVTLTLANTVSLLRGDPDPHGLLYGTAAGSFGLGYLLVKPRTLKLGRKFRLRPVVIEFPPAGG